MSELIFHTGLHTYIEVDRVNLASQYILSTICCQMQQCHYVVVKGIVLGILENKSHAVRRKSPLLVLYQSSVCMHYRFAHMLVPY